MSRLLKYWNTLRYLKFSQVKYQLYYRLRGVVGQNERPLIELPSNVIVNRLKLCAPVETYTSCFDESHFRFLNLEHEFQGSINWNFAEHGKLWTYNLNYFDFLHQAAFPPILGVWLMNDFAAQYGSLKDGKEPYPTSLRIINWISFVSQRNIADEEIDCLIYQDLKRLNKNIEYHLMGNHLLENAFALLFGAAYFQDKAIYTRSKAILQKQLEEQVLADGAHFELSPMYHQIMLSRLLSCIDLLSNNSVFEADQLLEFLQEKAELMLGWLREISFLNGSLPALNDSTEGIAPTVEVIKKQAEQLAIRPSKLELGASGYRKFVKPTYELLADIGNIGPDYIPGHAHSDTLNFLLNVLEQPVIVDTGISTYEKNTIRTAQRSTSAHNTVMVNGLEQSEVWGGFRVARRAQAIVLEESKDTLVAYHKGYEKCGVIHKRSFTFSNNEIQINDQLNRKSEAVAYLHFHFEIELELYQNKIKTNFGTLEFEGASNVKIEYYDLALGFNNTIKAQKAVITFSKYLNTHIHIS